MFKNLPETSECLSVSQLNATVADVLSSTVGMVWVRGEISTLTRATSGHLYLSLKDESASVRAVMFRSRVSDCHPLPVVGDEVEIQAAVGLYEPRGEFQLNIQRLRRAGQGSLYEQFQRLKDRLQAEGLFDSAHKRPIARHPRAIGVITSLGAAALHDVLKTLRRRAVHVPVVIYPSLVQGSDAPRALRMALAQANARAEVDTLLLVRGGGSLEDLWAFNDEQLVRDIAASAIAVIAGVGHESDITLADFVADLRAPTPTAAAELSCTAKSTLVSEVLETAQRLVDQWQRRFERLGQQLDRLSYRLISPSQRVAQQAQRLALLSQRLGHALPDVLRLQTAVLGLKTALAKAMHHRLAKQQSPLDVLTGRLLALNPEVILSRGYAIVRAPDGSILHAASQAHEGERLELTLSQGTLGVRVESSSCALVRDPIKPSDKPG
jgi:exodeoxyribonuclease VII large subunit